MSESMEEVFFTEKVRELPSAGETPLPQLASIVPSQRKLHPRLSLWLAIGLMGLLLVGAIGWLLFVQLAPNSDPWQRFTSTKLGFSLLYPTDWHRQIDHNPSIVHFSDSTQTSKFDVNLLHAVSGQLLPYLQQKATQLGITGVKSEAPLFFAHSSWQQVQGTLSQEGVNYSVVMLATSYRNQLYLLTQSNPQSISHDEERLVFAPMRAGWQFLA